MTLANSLVVSVLLVVLLLAGGAPAMAQGVGSIGGTRCGRLGRGPARRHRHAHGSTAAVSAAVKRP